MRQTNLWSSSQEDADRLDLGSPTHFALSRKVLQRHTHLDSSMIMNHSRSDRSLIHPAENPEPFYPRPTLPSLRSQVGEYLPIPSHSDLQPPQYYHHQDARLRPNTGSGSRRLSVSSSSLGSNSRGPRSSAIRSPSTEGRQYVSSKSSSSSSSALNPHPAASSQSSSSLTDSPISAQQTSFSGGTHVPPLAAAIRSTVSVACTNCRSAHLACSDGRPCRRCLQTGRAATCIDVEPLKTILEQPFSTFIHPDEKQEYARFSIGLLAYPGVTSRPVPVSASRLHQVALSELTTRLSGAATHTHVFRLRCANSRWIPFKFEAFLGSGFGAHPSDKDTLRTTYVVLRLFPVGVRVGRTTAPRGDVHSPSSSSNSSSYSIPEPRREAGNGTMGYYGYDGGVTGTSYPSPCGLRDSHDHRAHRQSFSGLYGHSYDTSRPPSRSGYH